MRKLIASACASPLSLLFALLDGVADPQPDAYGGYWPVFEISHSENGDVLYEQWLEGYWLWRERRPDKEWKLDTLDD